MKLLPKKYESDFFDGNLYLNTNAYFGTIDHTDSVRFDPHDGVDESRQVSKVEIQDGSGNWLPLPVVGPITTRSGSAAKLNILCLYTVTDRTGDSFDTRNLAFGDVAVVIGDVMEFIQRIKAAATKANKQVLHGPIQYVERATHDGAMGPFRKYTEHRYQNEFRFVFHQRHRNSLPTSNREHPRYLLLDFCQGCSGILGKDAPCSLAGCPT